MSISELTLTLDRADATYHFGEDVNGTVRVDTASRCHRAQIALEWQWRTHGRGNPDSGNKSTRKVFEGDWGAGETYCYPFRFRAPRGPETYHGNYLNVDWYLCARAGVHGASERSVEKEFLLICPNRRGEDSGADVQPPGGTSAYDLGPTFKTPPPIQDEINPGILRLIYGLLLLIGSLLALSYPSAPFLHIDANLYFLAVGLWLTALSLLIFLSVLHNFRPATRLTPVGLLLGIGVFLLGVALLSSWMGSFALPVGGAAVALVALSGVYRGVNYRRIGRIAIRIQPVVVRRGGTIEYRVFVPASSEGILTDAEATLACQERVTKTIGTDNKTHEYRVCKHARPLVCRFGGTADRVMLEALVTVPEDAPSSFSSTSSELVWEAGIRLCLKGFPAWNLSYPVAVCP